MAKLEIEITDKMIRAGVDAFADWEENEHHLEDWVSEPAARTLVRRILETCLSLPHQEGSPDQHSDLRSFL